MSSTRSGKRRTKSDAHKDEVQQDEEEIPSGQELMNTLKRIEANLAKVLTSQENIETRFDALDQKMAKHERLLEDLENSISFNNKEIQDLKETSTRLQKQVKAYEKEIKVYQKGISELEGQVENLERYSRNFNLRFVGVPEVTDHNEDCKSKITEMIKKGTGLNIDIENAHRIGRSDTGRPRHIIVKFLRRTDRFEVLKARGKLRESGLIVTEDLIQKDLQKRRQLTEVMSNAKSRGQRVRFTRGDLYLDGVKYNPT